MHISFIKRLSNIIQAIIGIIANFKEHGIFNMFVVLLVLEHFANEYSHSDSFYGTGCYLSPLFRRVSNKTQSTLLKIGPEKFELYLCNSQFFHKRVTVQFSKCVSV